MSELPRFACETLEGLEGPPCATRGCAVESARATGWICLDERDRWSLEFECPEHGVFSTAGARWRETIDEALAAQREFAATQEYASPEEIRDSYRARERAVREEEWARRHGTWRRRAPLPRCNCYHPPAIRAMYPGVAVPDGYCALCDRCGAPGHVWFRGFSGRWCARCRRQLAWRAWRRSPWLWLLAAAVAAGIWWAIF